MLEGFGFYFTFVELIRKLLSLLADVLFVSFELLGARWLCRRDYQALKLPILPPLLK